MPESGQPVLYLASSPLLSLRKGGVVMLLHNAVVVPAFVSCFFLGIDTGGSIAAAAMSMLLCPTWAGVAHATHRDGRTGNEANYFGSSMCLPLGIGSLVAPTRARIDRGMFGLLHKIEHETSTNRIPG